MSDRIQIKRRADVPPGVVLAVTKPWGNPFRVIRRPAGHWVLVGVDGKFADRADASQASTAAFELWLAGAEFARVFPARRAEILKRLPELRGKTLACFCSPHVRCHANVLVELANQ